MKTSINFLRWQALFFFTFTFYCIFIKHKTGLDYICDLLYYRLQIADVINKLLMKKKITLGIKIEKIFIISHFHWILSISKRRQIVMIWWALIKIPSSKDIYQIQLTSNCWWILWIYYSIEIDIVHLKNGEYHSLKKYYVF